MVRVLTEMHICQKFLSNEISRGAFVAYLHFLGNIDTINNLRTQFAVLVLVLH